MFGYTFGYWVPPNLKAITKLLILSREILEQKNQQINKKILRIDKFAYLCVVKLTRIINNKSKINKTWKLLKR
jgi:hypothetical protein